MPITLIDSKLGLELIRVRARAGLTPENFARLAKVEVRDVLDVEAGADSLDEDTLQKICRTMRCLTARGRTMPGGGQMEVR